MSHKQAIHTYTQLFNHRIPKDEEFYKRFFTTPVLESALLSCFQANSESLNSLSGASGNDAKVLQDIFIVGIKLLSDAIEYPDISDDGSLPIVGNTTIKDLHSAASNGNLSNNRSSVEKLGNNGHSSHSLASSLINDIDDGGEDVTDLKGNRRSSSVSHQKLNVFDDGDDITTLNGQTPVTPHQNQRQQNRRGSSVSIESSSSSLQYIQENESTIPPSPRKRHSSQKINLLPQRKFADIDDELRSELIVNITKILEVWLRNMTESSKANYKTYKALKINNPQHNYHHHNDDLIFKLFKLPGTSEILNDSNLYDLLVQVNWYLQDSIERIEEDIKRKGQDDFKNLYVIKEFIFLIFEVLRLLFQSLVILNRFKSDQNDLVILQSLLYSFYKVDLPKTIDKLLSLTNNKIIDSEIGKFELPKIRLSYETLMKTFTLVGALSNVPSRILLDNKVSLSSDITTLDTELPNIYENLITKVKKFDDISVVKEQINLKILPILAMQFTYYYKLRPDLLVYQIKNTSFLNWITGNRFNDNLYLNYDPISTTTDLDKNGENLSYVEHDPYLKEISSILEKKELFVRSGDYDIDDQLLVDGHELLPVYLLLYTYVRNYSFLKIFTKQVNEIHHKIEDYTTEQEKEVEILELWLCLNSYIYQYQYKTDNNKILVKLSLLILLKITSTNSHLNSHTKDEKSVIENLSDYQINVFKWKLCHHKLPVIPNGFGKEGFKSALLYIIDDIQILLRFNLTKKLSVDNFKIGITILYQILSEFKKNVKDGKGSIKKLSNYSWVDLYKTLLGVIKFIKKQISYHENQLIKSLIEEIYLVFEIILSNEFNTVIQLNNDFEFVGKHLIKSINYELVYEILLNFELIIDLFNELIHDKQNFPNLQNCFEYLQKQFNLNEVEEKATDYSKQIEPTQASGSEKENEAKDEGKIENDDENGVEDTGDEVGNKVEANLEESGHLTQKMSALDFDYNSPELINKISNFTFNTNESEFIEHENTKKNYNYQATFKYIYQPYSYNNFEENDSNGELYELYKKLFDIKW